MERPVREHENWKGFTYVVRAGEYYMRNARVKMRPNTSLNDWIFLLGHACRGDVVRWLEFSLLKPMPFDETR